jgi:peptidoglycan hydrolase-like protein with peptidoglycan-binding domain
MGALLPPFDPVGGSGTNALAWQTIKANGIVTPGLCWLRGFKRPFGWDKKTGKGSPVTTITFQTTPPCEGEVEFLLWLPEHYAAFPAIQSIFTYDKTLPTQAVDVYHPSLANINAKSFVCEWQTALEPVNRRDPTCQRAIFKLYEYQQAPAKNITTTTSGSKPNATTAPPGQKPDPNQDLQNQIQAERFRNQNVFGTGVGPVL